MHVLLHSDLGAVAGTFYLVFRGTTVCGNRITNPGTLEKERCPTSVDVRSVPELASGGPARRTSENLYTVKRVLAMFLGRFNPPESQEAVESHQSVASAINPPAVLTI